MELIREQIKAIIDKEVPLISNLSNVSAVLNQMENINWCGFYIVKGDTLYLGPFQGEAACTKIEYGKGVCGTSLKEERSIIVPNVNEFKGHIACSTKSKSEIVVPIKKDNKIVALIDIDSPIYNRFSEVDKLILEDISSILSELF